MDTDNNYRFQIENIFPTSVLRFDASSMITEKDVEIMKQEIDSIIDDKTHMQINELTPNWQSIPILFNPKFVKNTALWEKLNYTFYMACNTYLKEVENFVNNQDNLSFLSFRAWFYKTSEDSISYQSSTTNPTHNHHPSFLSGVFYLEVPSDAEGGGTILCDTRQLTSTRDVLLDSMNLSWIIFPGWMNHRTGPFKCNTPRYVIAADSYVGVNS
jgi:hypothetical protein